MRTLTASQKAIIDRECKAKNYRTPYGELVIGLRSVEDLPSGVWDKLEEINDTEILYQQTNGRIEDFLINLVHC